MRLVKAAKASPHAKFYNLSSVYNYVIDNIIDLITQNYEIVEENV